MSRVGASLFTTGDLISRMSRRGGWLTHDELRERVTRVVDAGFDFLELTADVGLVVTDLYNRDTVDWLAAVARDRGLAFTVHLPFYGVNVSLHEEGIRRAAVAASLRCAEWFEALDVRGYVLHTCVGPLARLSQSPGILHESARLLWEPALEATARSYEELAAEIPREKLFLENLPDAPFEMTDLAVSQLNARTCLDVGHVLLRNDDLHQRFAQWRSRIGHVHFHDVVEQTDNGRTKRFDHQRLGEGIIDMGTWIPTLAEALDDEVCVCLEMDLDNAIESLDIWNRHTGTAAAT